MGTDYNSGTMRSVEYALKMGKPIYVLPHRINESDGTNKLLENNSAKAIYDIDKFIDDFLGFKGEVKHESTFLEYCKTNPTYDEAMELYPTEVFENELNGTIKIQNGKVVYI